MKKGKGIGGKGEGADERKWERESESKDEWK